MFENKPEVQTRLRDSVVIWLTTVRDNGQPQTSLVWYLLEGDEIVVYSKARTARTRNIASNPGVALNLDGDGDGGAVVTLEGTAHIDADAPPSDEHAAYLEKYSQRIASNGWTPADFARDYPVAIRIRLDRGRAW